MMRLRGGKVHGLRTRAEPIFADDGALPTNGIRQRSILRWIDLINAAAKHRQRASAGVQCCFVRDGINAQRQPADDRNAVAGQFGCQSMGDFTTIGAGSPRAHKGNSRQIGQRQSAINVEHRW